MRLMKQIDYITVHCSATKPNFHGDVDAIRDMHLKRGFSDIGYHIVITQDGTIQPGRPLKYQGAQVKGHNANNVGICLIGGLDENGKAANTFSQDQLDSLQFVITDLVGKHGVLQKDIKGHRDWFQDLNGDGILDKRDWLKECPCFDVQQWLKSLL